MCDDTIAGGYNPYDMDIVGDRDDDNGDDDSAITVAAADSNRYFTKRKLSLDM